MALIAFLFPCTLHAQLDTGFARVDRAARAIQYHGDIYRLARDLAAPYQDTLFKVRSIFIWITNNIRYDYRLFNSGREIKFPDCEGKPDCALILAKWQYRYLRRVIRRRKALCDGYARLFDEFCRIDGIRSEMVSGYARSEPYQVGSSFFSNHSWNAVWLDSAWHFLDPTWAAGGCGEDEETGRLVNYTKEFNDYYWMTPPAKLERDHYPDEARWVYNDVTKEKFTSTPYYAPGILPIIDLYEPATGIITAKIGDTLRFRFSYSRAVYKMQINTNIWHNPSIYTFVGRGKKRKSVLDTFAYHRQKYLDVRKKGDVYTFDYVVDNTGLDYLDVLFDYVRVMRFRVRVKEQE